MTKDEPTKNTKKTLKASPQAEDTHFISAEISDASSERCSSLICLGDLGVLVVGFCLIRVS